MPRLVPQSLIDAVKYGDTHDPFGILGMHSPHDGGAVQIRVFDPYADRIEAIEKSTGRSVATLEKVDPAGFFVAEIEGRADWFAYFLRIVEGESVREVEDAYRFGPWLGELDCYLFAEGNHLQPWEKLGAHPAVRDGVAGTAFAVWAPNARRISVVGDFNNWDGRRHMMRNRGSCGIWEIFIPHVRAGDVYKFEIKSRDGTLMPLKFDPYGFYAEKRPANAAVVHGVRPYEWTDGAWMEKREKDGHRLDGAMSIYEVHLGSWMLVPDDAHRFLTYRELAERLIPYVCDLGFTHVELLPMHEHPFDGSWGYQPVGLFAPTSRFGTPEDFKFFVESCHRAGIGVIIDWVPGHFPTDAHGLAYFDGTHLYEHADPRKGKHMDWGTLIFNFGRTEICNFLIANALFWVEVFHIDGLRVDAVASMLYLDYSRGKDEWLPNAYGGNENLEAIAFMKRLNEVVYTRGRGAFTLAEESTAWPMVSRPAYVGGLGFGFKWNMGWMHDTLDYLKKEAIHRRYHQNQLTFGLLYAFSENFVLPLSHDEVVHGKGSLFGRMSGDRWQKFASLRAYYGFMWAHPGKKLLFMGGEFAQEREWNFQESLDWHLLENDSHRQVKETVKTLNLLYASHPAFYDQDFTPSGFEWIDCQDAESSVVSWIRWSKAGKSVVVVCNFTPVVRRGYRIGVPRSGRYREALNTDAEHFGGSGVVNGVVEAETISQHGRPYSLSLALPPLATLYLIPEQDEDAVSPQG